MSEAWVKGGRYGCGLALVMDRLVESFHQSSACSIAEALALNIADSDRSCSGILDIFLVVNQRIFPHEINYVTVQDSRLFIELTVSG